MKTLFGLGAGVVRTEAEAGRIGKSAAGGAAVLVILAASVAGVQTAAVPKAYADLYTQLEAKLQKTSERIDRQWDKSKAPVDFSAEMLTANSNRGVQLLQPVALWGVRMEMQRLQELNAKAVTLSINFPVLYEPFHQLNGTSHQAFLDFYKHVAEDARGRKLKVIVEMGSGIFPGVYSQGSGLNAQGFYARIKSIEEYREQRTAMALAVARELRPDYLSLTDEPDTEAKLTSLPVNHPRTGTGIVAYEVKKLHEAGVTDVKIGAGVGTWQRQADEWVRSYTQNTGVDYIALHVYPINSLSPLGRYDLLWQLFTLADIARAGGKPVGVGECWLHKTRDRELRRMNNITDPTAFERDIYSFWEPLDTQFLSVMVRGAHWKRFVYLSPFWTRMLYGGYVDYDEAQRVERGPQGAARLFALSNRQAAEDLRAGRFSPTGAAYGRMIQGNFAGTK